MEPEGDFLPEPLQILEREEIELRNQTIARVKVQWKHFTTEEATWEREAEMMENYPSMLPSTWNTNKKIKTIVKIISMPRWKLWVEVPIVYKGEGHSPYVYIW